MLKLALPKESPSEFNAAGLAPAAFQTNPRNFVFTKVVGVNWEYLGQLLLSQLAVWPTVAMS